MDRWLDQRAMPLPVMIESYHTMLVCVGAGMGAAWILRSVLVNLPGHQQVRINSLGAAGHTQIHYVWHNGHLSADACRLISVGEAIA